MNIGTIFITPQHSKVYQIYYENNEFYYGGLSCYSAATGCSLEYYGKINFPKGFKWDGNNNSLAIVMYLWNTQEPYDAKKSHEYVTINGKVYKSDGIITKMKYKV